MPQFDPELIQVMRSVLDDVMNRVPLDISGTTAKVYLAETILKTAAQGHTSYNELMAAATDQIQVSYQCSHNIILFRILFGHHAVAAARHPCWNTYCQTSESKAVKHSPCWEVAQGELTSGLL
jgi:hypothetical protein